MRTAAQTAFKSQNRPAFTFVKNQADAIRQVVFLTMLTASCAGFVQARGGRRVDRL